jgi:hypothetical protein
VQLHKSTAHLLYKYCTICRVYNWTALTVTTMKLLLHVQLHHSREIVMLMSFEEGCSRLFEVVCIYRMSHQEVRLFKVFKITTSTKAKHQLHCTTQHPPVTPKLQQTVQCCQHIRRIAMLYFDRAKRHNYNQFTTHCGTRYKSTGLELPTVIPSTSQNVVSQPFKLRKLTQTGSS